MRAILPGRPQPKPQALCTANWDGLRLVVGSIPIRIAALPSDLIPSQAYLSGNTVCILKGPREIVQTLRIDHLQALTAVTIEESSGRLALCDDTRVCVYNPVGREQDDLRWILSEELTLDQGDAAYCLSWGSAEELLVGGTRLWLYHIPFSNSARIIWNQRVSSPVHLAGFSNDAELIATCGQHDRLVKIWRRLSFEIDNIRFDASYLSHPATVTNLHWRKPWHVEQSLDPLLYTFCSDNHIRLWVHSDPHSLSIMQAIATIDTVSSIQPRRLSVGSISRRRYAFILDSRDFFPATEKALQGAPSNAIDHALEHLIEVANRSPEICVVLDGLGHMSAWGVENAGTKSKLPAVVFNVALVDDVRAQLSFDQEKSQDYVQFCTFATSTFSSTLSLLVQSYTGQIDWYQSPVAKFFDTSSRNNRLQLISSWSGHDVAIDHMARSLDDGKILSWTDDGQAIVWSQTASGALKRRCELTTPGVIAVLLLGKHAKLIIMYHSKLILWDISAAHGVEKFSVKLKSGQTPVSLRPLSIEQKESTSRTFLVEYQNSLPECWQIWLESHKSDKRQMNGSFRPITRVNDLPFKMSARCLPSLPCDRVDVHQVHDYQISFPLLLPTRENTLLCYRAADLVGKETAQPYCDMRCTTQDFTLARVAAGHLAAVCLSGNSLTIWSLIQSAVEWQYTLKGPEQIQKLVWSSSPSGQLLLFVGLGYHALVVGQARYCMDREKSTWEILQDVNIRRFTTNSIGDVSWLPGCDLAIAAGNQIFVLECIANRLPGRETPSQTARKNIVFPKIVNVVNHQAALLPIFSATYLEHVFLQGEHDLVHKILLSFYEKLKYFVDGDEIDSFLGHTPMKWIENEIPRNDTTQSNDQHAGIADVEDSFHEYLQMTSLWQLPRKDKDELTSLLTALLMVEKYRKSLDDNAARYLYFFYLTSPEKSLPWKAFTFASRSSSQEALLDIVMAHYNGKMTWEIARRTGVFAWLSDPAVIRVQFENVAKAEYTKHEDRNPVDCSLYYLALNKKSVLQGLWRMTVGVREKENTMKLLANNFEIAKWRSTAIKNAYALLSRRRFEYAAAFFLLGDSLKDAVNVCVNQLEDIQLAVTICKVWDKDGTEAEAVLRSVVESAIMPRAAGDEHGRWMATWAFGMLQDPTRALQAIVRPLRDMSGDGLATVDDGVSRSGSFRANDPHLVLLYCQLRDDLIRQGRWTSHVISQRDEQKFILRNVDWLLRSGLHLSALQLARDWRFVKQQPVVEVSNVDNSMELSNVLEPTKSPPVITSIETSTASRKPPPTQFVEPSADSLLDSFGF